MSAANELPSWREVLLRGHRTFPKVPWAAASRWNAKPLTLLILIFGLSLFGVGEALLYLSRLGNSPWVVLSEGLALRTDLDLGLVNGLVSVAVLALWLPLRERPGLGTILNIILISWVLELMVTHLPMVSTPVVQYTYAIGGLLLVGLASALYITTNLGPGPRDGLMTALHHRTGIRVSRVRLSLETVVFISGWLLGGRAGIGTLIFALFIGRAIALWLGVLARLVHPHVQ